MTVRMVHPDLDGEYDAQPGQVPHLRNAGWVEVEGQAEQGETWPAEALRFDGQEQVRMRHPELGAGQAITVARSAVPYHQERGWLEVTDQPPVEGTSAPSTRRRRGQQHREA